MSRELPTINYKKQKCTIDFRLEEMRCGRTMKVIKFKDMKEGKNSPVKKKLRGIRFRTGRQEYIQGLDD